FCIFSELMPADKQLMDNMEMFNDLLPCSQKAALLFHLSYLCMANFPELERKLRAKATESQQLFSSSAILLLECASTGDNIVKMLFPMIRAAVEKKNAVLAVKILEKAKSWIQDTCNKVDETVKKYETLDKDVGDTCSDVIKTKVEKEKKKGEKTAEAKALESRVNALEVKLKSLKEESEEVEKSIKEENKKLEEMVNGIADRDRKFAIAAAAVPIFGLIVYGFQKLINDPKDKAAMSVSKSRLEEFNKQRKSLSSQSWKHEMELITLQMEYSKAQIKIGSVGDPSQLKDVQKCLTRIQQILKKMKQFWETTGVALENLKQKTFAGEDMIEFLGDCQDLFLQSLDVAENAWKSFGAICMHVKDVFRVQSEDAYKFLECSPSSLSQEEWQKEYNDVMKQLNELEPAPLAVQDKESLE
ncbi:hypothetical protein HHUSO_G21501, partial [Huso huso]